ncbi:hypothetical protein ATO6_18970 [Oceanicola sp. 22II-s10i]|uniref:Na+/H+ antiporter subunit E n=1 Tax=Oceanicola sp. 22II-s10i TaxID=1317116 RepID=UPI000B51F11D|nr:Na+/H+ antiporter subunit E [Oceanicola sp. 22II-s10i]OWU83231.1 hypothetical protein ATO6_18970 [Oceanicola sp. 22II-s10i]
MPKLIRLYISSVLTGFAIAAVFAALLIWFDVGHLRHLAQGPDGVLAVFLLWFFNGIVFAGVQFAYRIMRMADKPEGPRGGTRAPVTLRGLAPVRAEARAPRR